MEEPVQRDEHFLCTPVTKCVLTVIKGTSFDRKTLDSDLTNCCFGVESFEILGLKALDLEKLIQYALSCGSLPADIM